MGPENLEAKGTWKQPQERIKHRLISHGGKDKTVDMSTDPDLIKGSVDPARTLKDIKLLRRVGRKPKKFSHR